MSLFIIEFSFSYMGWRSPTGVTRSRNGFVIRPLSRYYLNDIAAIASSILSSLFISTSATTTFKAKLLYVLLCSFTTLRISHLYQRKFSFILLQKQLVKFLFLLLFSNLNGPWINGILVYWLENIPSRGHQKLTLGIKVAEK